MVKVEKNAEAEWGVEWALPKLEELKALVAEAKACQREAARSPKDKREGGGTAGSCREAEAEVEADYRASRWHQDVAEIPQAERDAARNPGRAPGPSADGGSLTGKVTAIFRCIENLLPRSILAWRAQSRRTARKKLILN